MENLLICLTRGLVAAAITCCVVPILFLLDVASIRLRKGFGPLDAEFFTYLGYAAAKLIVMYGMLIAFISSAITVLWILSFTRPWVIRAWRRPWVAAIVGFVTGTLISLVLGASPWAGFPIHAAITGTIFCFLHAFFIQRTLAKKAWLEKTHPEHNR